MKALKAANNELVKALQDDKLSIEDIKTLGKEVNNLRVAVDALAGDR